MSALAGGQTPFARFYRGGCCVVCRDEKDRDERLLELCDPEESHLATDGWPLFCLDCLRRMVVLLETHATDLDVPLGPVSAASWVPAVPPGFQLTPQLEAELLEVYRCHGRDTRGLTPHSSAPVDLVRWVLLRVVALEKRLDGVVRPASSS